MKKTIYRAVLILAILIVSTTAFAEDSWTISAGVSVGIIDEKVRAASPDGVATLTVDNVISPFIRAGYDIDSTWSLELQGALDCYGGRSSVSNPWICGDSDPLGWSLAIAPVWHGEKRSIPWLGDGRPLVKAGIRCSWLRNDLKFLATSYEPSPGLDIACGMTFDKWQLQLSATSISHRKRTTAFGYAGPDDLDLSRISLEITVPDDTILDFFGKD